MVVQLEGDAWIYSVGGKRDRRAAPSGYQIVPRVAWSPDGRLQAVGKTPGTVEFVNATGMPIGASVRMAEMLGWRSTDRVVGLDVQLAAGLLPELSIWDIGEPERGPVPWWTYLPLLPIPLSLCGCYVHVRVFSILAASALITVPVTPAVKAPDTPDFGRWADPYSEYEPEDRCSPEPKPGVLALRDMLNVTYGVHTAYMSPPRGCTSAISEHEDGRALDYMLDANDPAEKAIADEIFNWLLATDRHGNAAANARRLGIMYMVWNRQIWSSNQPVRGWRAYTGWNPHTDHIHFSFNHDGANERTTWWSTSQRTHFADLDGDGRDEIVLVRPNGRVDAWRNGNQIAPDTYPDAGKIEIAHGFTPTGIRFADLDGDRRADLVNVDTAGKVLVWRNTAGYSTQAYGLSEPLTVGTGFDSAQVRFADLDGDGRDEIVSVDHGSTVRAWRNTAGIDGNTYSAEASVRVGSGFDVRRTKFGDFDGDGRDEIVHVAQGDEVKVWRNVHGLASNTYSSAYPITVGTGFTPARTRLGDLDGDGRAELVLLLVNGEVKVWPNCKGLITGTYVDASAVTVGSSFPI